MARFRNWIATFGALALGVTVLPGTVGADATARAVRPMADTTAPGLAPAVKGVAPGPEWIGDSHRVVDPPQVTYVRNPLMDDPGAGLVGNRASWVSGIETRDRALGTIDVISGGFEIDVARAKVSCDTKVDVTSDGPLSVTLLGCGGAPRTF